MNTPLTVRAVFDRLLTAFQIRDYRLVWGSNFLYYTGRLMTNLVMGWFILELTNSPFWVGLLAGVDGVGSLLFGVLGGVLADRFDRRLALLLSQVISGALFAVLGVLALTGQIAPWHLLVIALFQGALNAVQSPATGVVVYQVVDRQKLLNASAAQMFSFTLARISGAALGGPILAAWGAGPAFLVAAAIMGLSGLPLLYLHGTFRSQSAPVAMWQAAASGMRYAWANGPLRTLLLLSPLFEIFAFSYNYMLPVIARDVLNVGPVGLGWLSSAGGLGAAAGVLLMASLGDARHKSTLLMASTTSAGLGLILFSFTRAYPLALALAAGIGIALVCYDVLMQTLIQLLTSDEVRGRVFSLYTLGFGFNSLGGFAAGVVATAIGTPLAVGAAGVCVLGLTAWVARRIRQIRPEEEAAPSLAG